MEKSEEKINLKDIKGLLDKDLLLLLGNNDFDIIFMLDETVPSINPILDNTKRYIKGENDYFYSFYMVVIPFLRINHGKTKKQIKEIEYYYRGKRKLKREKIRTITVNNYSYYSLHNILGGYYREIKKKFQYLNSKMQINFLESVRSELKKKYDRDISLSPIYADKRPISIYTSKNNPKLGLLIKSKRITQRIDAVFGCKQIVYNEVKRTIETKNGLKRIIKKEYKGLDIYNKYEDMWEKMNIAEI